MGSFPSLAKLFLIRVKYCQQAHYILKMNRAAALAKVKDFQCPVNHQVYLELMTTTWSGPRLQSHTRAFWASPIASVCFCIFNYVSKGQSGEMVQWVKVPEVKPEDLNLIPGSHMVEADNWLLEVVIWPPHALPWQPPPPHTHTHQQNKCLKKLEIVREKWGGRRGIGRVGMGGGGFDQNWLYAYEIL